MVIYRITPARKITEFIKTGDWKPFSFHSSRINRNILVGMIKGDHAKVTRYSKTGKKIKSKQRDRVNFHYQCYITENINGNICTSDIIKLAVVVVNRSWQNRFSYTGQASRFVPWGISTDVFGHILVCDGNNHSVDLLDKEGGFISVILSSQQGIKYPLGVFVWMMRTISILDNTTPT